jgi:hypothetical protein
VTILLIPNTHVLEISIFFRNIQSIVSLNFFASLQTIHNKRLIFLPDFAFLPRPVGIAIALSGIGLITKWADYQSERR